MPASGRAYNLEVNPPKEEGKDDLTGDPLFKRSQLEVTRKRLEVYDKTENKDIDYYNFDLMIDNDIDLVFDSLRMISFRRRMFVITQMMTIGPDGKAHAEQQTVHKSGDITETKKRIDRDGETMTIGHSTDDHLSLF